MTVLKMHDGTSWKAVSGPPGPPGTGGGGGLDQATADTLYVNVNGDTMTGMLTLQAANPTDNNHAVRKLYVDNEVANKLSQAVADSLYAPLSRTINTTAPLSGGGDLNANRTLAITSFAGSAAGAVPASAGGTTNFLRADGTWAAPPSGTGDAVLSATQTFTGANTFTQGVTVDSPSTAYLALDRGATSNFGQFEFRTAGAQKWAVGTWNGGTEGFRIFNAVTSLTPLTIDPTTDLITLKGDPTAALGAVTKQYVDTRVANKITVSNTAPSSPAVNDVWIDTT